MKRPILLPLTTILLLASGVAAQATEASATSCDAIENESCPYEEFEELETMSGPVALMECRIGGKGVDSCKVRCNEIFGWYYSDCSVECDDEYYACCNCDDGATCQCYLDHMELWPISPLD